MRAFFGALALALTGAAPAAAYTIEGGTFTLKPVVGAAVNVLRLDVATRETPPAALIAGLDLDYSLDGPWNLAITLRPEFSAGYIDGELGLGVKYRFTQLDAPFIPYLAAVATTSVGGPLGYGDVHFNLGARVSGGVDYFVIHDLAVGLEIGAEAGGVLTPIGAAEMTMSVLAGLTWKL